MQKCREQKVKIRERESNQEQPFQPRMKNIFTKKKKTTHTRQEGNDPDKQKPHLLPTNTESTISQIIQPK